MGPREVLGWEGGEGDGRVRVPVPPNPFVPDRIAFGFTVRQLTILSVAAIAVWGVFLSLSQLLPAVVTGAICAPIAAVGVLAIATAPDGTPMDRYLLRALFHTISPKLSVLAPEGVPRGLRLGAVDLGIRRVSARGFVELKDGMTVAIMKASGINLRLRSEAENEAVADSFGRLLNSLDSPIQFLVSSSRIDAEELISPLEETARYMPHPLLTDSCLDFCRFFRTLVDREGLLRRQRLVCFKERSSGSVEASLLRRAGHVATQLREAGVQAELLEGEECRTLVLSAADPDYASRPPPAGARKKEGACR